MEPEQQATVPGKTVSGEETLWRDGVGGNMTPAQCLHSPFLPALMGPRRKLPAQDLFCFFENESLMQTIVMIVQVMPGEVGATKLVLSWSLSFAQIVSGQ